MQISKFFMTIIILTLFIPGLGLGGVYYIDATNGDNDNDGSQSRPWKTLSKVSYSDFAPGDNILLKRGEAWNENLLALFSGNSDNPISINAYGEGDSPIINGWIYVAASNINFQNLEVKGSELAGFVMEASSSQVTLRNNEIHDHMFAGVMIVSGMTVNYNIQDNAIYNNQFGVIAFNNSTESDVTRIIGNTIQNNSNGGIVIQGSHQLVEANTITGSNMAGITLNPDCSNIIVRNNEISDHMLIGIFIDPNAGSSNLIQDNTFNRNPFGIIAFNSNNDGEETLITSNNISACDNYGVFIGGTHMVLEQNTIINGSGYGISIDATSSHVSVKNNEVSGNAQTGIWLSPEVDGNIEIIGNQVCDNLQHGIAALDNALHGAETIIANNEVFRNGYNGILLQGDYHLVEYNVVRDNGIKTLSYDWGATGIQVYAEDIESAAAHNIIRFNTVSGTIGNAYGSDGNGILIDEWCHDNVIHHNITYKNEGPGLGVYGGSQNYFLNNLSYNNSINDHDNRARLEILVMSKTQPLSANNIFHNNIAFAVDSDVTTVMVGFNSYDENNQFGNNLFFHAQPAGYLFRWNMDEGDDIELWNMLASGSGDDFSDDPLLADPAGDDFHINADSPCINNGMDALLTKDFYGNLISSGQGSDIGVHEFVLND